MEQIDPRGDMLKLRGDGEGEPGGLIPPYEGRTKGFSDDQEVSEGAESAG